MSEAEEIEQIGVKCDTMMYNKETGNHRIFRVGEEIPIGYVDHPSKCSNVSRETDDNDGEPGDEDGSISDEEIEAVAKACYNANRKYCQSIGDDSQPVWSKASKWQKDSVINGVKAVIDNPDQTPGQSHENWFSEKEADGWKYGEVKDADKKEHPCFVPYDELPDEHKKKDAIFLETARAELTKLVA